MKLRLVPITVDNLEYYWQAAWGKSDLEWMKFNGPYFKDPAPEHDEFVEKIGIAKYVGNPLNRLIIVNNKIVGMVGANYEDGELKRWLDFGIVIFSQDNWSKGIGTEVLKQWISYLFDLTDLPHLSFTTWSGNPGMIKLGYKLGMQEEARIRQVRYWNNQYWDSVKFGILQNEWKRIKDYYINEKRIIINITFKDMVGDLL